MLVDNLLNSEWEHVSDWENMRSSVESEEESEYTESDFDNFAEIKFREVAEELGVKYSTVKDLLYGRNIDFFETKARIFADWDSISTDAEEYQNLIGKLTIPVIYFSKKVNTVNTLLGYLDELSLDDKIDILDRLSRVTLEVKTDNNKEARTISFLEQYNQLEPRTKYEVTRGVLALEVTILP